MKKDDELTMFKLKFIHTDTQIYILIHSFIQVWDLGGQQRFRAEWPRYTSGCNVIIFVVDANDVERIPVARKELHQLLEDRNLARIPLLVCLNKIDLEPHLTKEEVIKQLNLDYITENPWIVIPIRFVVIFFSHFKK